MPVNLSQYRGVVGGEGGRGFNSQFMPNKLYNFFYSDSFRKLNMPAVSSVSFLILICLFMKLLGQNSLPYVFLLRKNIEISYYS